MKQTREWAEKRLNDINNATSQYLETWKELRNWISPSSGNFKGDTNNNGAEVENKDNINSIPRLAARDFSTMMYSYMTNPTNNWFKTETEDKEIYENHTVKIWLEELENKIKSIFAQSNIYQSLKTMYRDIAVFAVSCALIEKDFEDVIRLRKFSIGEFYLGNDNKGRVNTYGRDFSMTVSQIVDEFGIENVSTSTKSMYNTKQMDSFIEICHLICPRKYIDDSKKDSLNMPVASYYWEKGNKENQFLSESGYETFPVVCPRWEVEKTSDTYGKNSPGWDTLSDVRELQTMEKNGLINLARIAQPAYQISSDVAAWDLRPNGVTIIDPVSGAVGVKPIDVVQVDMQKLDYSANVVAQRIQRAFFNDLILMFSQTGDPRMTATEVSIRNNEKLLALSPVLENINNNLLSPLLTETIKIILEAELISEPPEELRGNLLKIDYISTIAQAQKRIGTNSIEQVSSFMGNLVAVFPDITDNYNSDEAYRDYVQKIGISPKITRSREAVAARREQKALQTQQAQQQKQAADIVQGAKVLSETEIRPNTALTALTGE